MGYYSHLIQNFATLATPLMDLLTKQSPEVLQLNPPARRAINTLQHALVGTFVLVSPDFSQPFIVQTDASSTGLETVLSQIIAREWNIPSLSLAGNYIWPKKIFNN